MKYKHLFFDLDHTLWDHNTNSRIGLEEVYHQFNLLSLGVQYEQNRVVAEFGLASGEFTTKQEASKAGSRWGILVGDEFLFGQVAVVLQSGFYLHRYYSIQSMWFNRIGLRLYSPTIGRSKMQGHVGFFLKSHKADAEQFCVLGGFSF